MFRFLSLSVALFLGIQPGLRAQQITFEGVILDAQTQEPIPGVSVQLMGTPMGTSTDVSGQFRLANQGSPTGLLVSCIGYSSQQLALSVGRVKVALSPKVEDLQIVVVTASREAQARTDAPIAIARLSPTLLAETKATNLSELINKTPGVFMPNLNNEQHMMGIRQPFGTSAYFLYLEDGVPIRPMGVFNHNALIEVNQLAISSIEVVKGPTSSLYGPEAVGGAINFITHKPTAVPVIRLGVQGDAWGYKRVQLGAGGMVTKRLGVFLGGYYAKQMGSWQTSSDFDKIALNGRVDYELSKRTHLVGTYTYARVNSQTGGNVDSLAYYSRQYTSTTDFTYRKVYSIRSRITLEHRWNDHAESFATGFYRDNSIKQNPNYSIRWATGSLAATGEVNNNSFMSYGLIAQHSQRFSWLASRLLVGLTYDYSPTNYYAYQTSLEAQLRPDKKSVERYVQVAELPDHFLSHFAATIQNSALYGQFDAQPLPNLRLSMGARFDRMAFGYTNFIDQANGLKAFHQVTPKLGLTYDLGQGRGLYANVSRGFSPPGLTAIFRKNPNAPVGSSPFYYNLQPACFNNYELGGWASLVNRKVFIDWALYQMNGQNELLSIRQPDNSTDYQSAGRTLHRGIEYSLTVKPSAQWFLRFGGTNATHRFINFAISNRSTDGVQNLSGHDMPQAPKWIMNSEVTYKPRRVKGLRTAIEWQRVSPWFQNQINTVRYDDRTGLGLAGISVFNVRAGYTWKGIETYINVLNLTDQLYATTATRGNASTDRTVFTPAAPRMLVIGIQYQWSGK